MRSGPELSPDFPKPYANMIALIQLSLHVCDTKLCRKLLLLQEVGRETKSLRECRQITNERTEEKDYLAEQRIRYQGKPLTRRDTKVQ